LKVEKVFFLIQIFSYLSTFSFLTSAPGQWLTRPFIYFLKKL